MIFPYLVGIFMVALVVVHMANPRFRPQEISAARFFRKLQPAKRRSDRLSLGNPLRSLPLYVQFPLLAMGLMALLSAQRSYIGEEVSPIGVWVVVDTSASMSTVQQNGTRMTAAIKTVEEIVETIRSTGPQSEVCMQLSAFDQELRTVQPVTRNPGQILDATNLLEVRALGTDLSLIQQLLNQGPEFKLSATPSNSSPTQVECQITTVAVISDQPAPEWANAVYQVDLLWLDVGLQVANAGFTNISFTRDPLTGQVSQLRIDLEQYGPTSPAPQVEIAGPNGQRLITERGDWNQEGRWHASFEPQEAGLYSMELLPTDAYAYDNVVIVEVTSGKELNVDWALPNHPLLEQLPWRITDTNPDFRVASAEFPLDDRIPTLLIGNGYRGLGQVEEVVYFVQDHPLLSELNLDVAERVGIQGVQIASSFDIILMGKSVWIAEQQDPPAVFVPGLPEGEDPLWSFSITLFFNGVRHLLQTAPLPPLYTLTSPHAPNPSGNHLVLHPGEGNTYRTPHSIGNIENLQHSRPVLENNPFWPLWLCGLLLLFLIERSLFSRGGTRWR